MSRTLPALAGRRRGRALAAAALAALAAAPSAFADSSRSYELVTPAGSVAAEPVSVHPYNGGNGFGYRSYDGQLGALEGLWTGFNADRTATGWTSTRLGTGAPVHFSHGGSNTREPIATQTLGYSADGRTTWVLTMLALVPEDENTELGDVLLGSDSGSTDIYAITDGKPVLITKNALGKAAGIGSGLLNGTPSNPPGALNYYLAPDGNKLYFILSRPAGQVIAETDPGAANGSIFLASADGHVQRVDSVPAVTLLVLSGRPISDDGTCLLYVKNANLMLSAGGTTTNLGPAARHSHLSADGKTVTWSGKQVGDPFNRVRRYDVASGTTTLLSVAHDASAPTVNADLVDTSDDGQTTVFSTRDALTADTPGPGTPTTPNFYASIGGALRFIAQSPSWTTANGAGVRVTDNGQVFFTTAAALTAGDTDAALDLYRWSVADGVTLLSAGAGLGNSATSIAFAPLRFVQMPLGRDNWGQVAQRSRYAELISADGSWAFFTSTEQLTADAGDNGNTKVYGSRGDELVLISPAGADAAPAQYIGNSPSGRDVFFTTDQPLDWRDTDGRYMDIYDARVGGGFGPKPASPLDPCPANACPLPAPAGAGGAPATATSTGPGDATPSADPSNRFTVKARKTTLTVAVPGDGQLVVGATAKSGKTTKTVLRQTTQIGKPGSYAVQLRLNQAGRSALAKTKRGRLKLKVRVAFEPEGGFVRTQTVSVTFTKSGKR